MQQPSLLFSPIIPFEEVTREVPAEKYVSMSKVIPLVSLLKEAAATEHECTGSSFSAELAKQTQHRFIGIEA